MNHPGFAKLEQFLSRYDALVLSTHESPDWDGLGSEIALYHLLKKLGKDVLILNSDPLETDHRLIDPDGIITQFHAGFPLPADLSRYGQIVLDTNVYRNTGALSKELEGKIGEVFIIDHHEGNRDTIESNFIKIEASSVCEIIYQIYENFGEKPQYPSALALFCGIVFDTGSFRYSKTSSETFRIAAALVDTGVSPDAVYRHLYENNTLSSITIRNMILASMELIAGGKLAIMKMTPEMLEEAGAIYAEGELVINTPLTIRGVLASVLVKQSAPGSMVKVSMRSRDDINVARIAIKNGGGGHRNAAGYKSSLEFEETYRVAKEEVLRLLEK